MVITVVIPVYNEAKNIRSIVMEFLSYTYKVIVVEGRSTDKTKDILLSIQEEFHDNLVIIDNPERTVPYALNLAIQHAGSEFIVRADGHCRYPKNYVQNLVNYLVDHQDVDNVGCMCRTLPGADTNVAKSIAVALSSPWSVGNTMFRIGITKPTETDTVPFGCFRRDVFTKYGLFDTDLTRNDYGTVYRCHHKND